MTPARSRPNVADRNETLLPKQNPDRDLVVGAGRPQVATAAPYVGAHLNVCDAIHVLVIREVFRPAAGRAPAVRPK